MTLEQLVGNATAFLLTLLVFSYILGDNPLYRIALHLFVGVAAGYTSTVVIREVLKPRLFDGWGSAIEAYTSSNNPAPLISLTLLILVSILILLKLSPRLAPFGNTAIAFVVGVGAAVAASGAITGTLFPQVRASWANPFATGAPLYVFNTLVILISTLLAFMYFFYSARALPGGKVERPAPLKALAFGGQIVITITLAALYVGALAASLALFTERVTFLYEFIIGLTRP
jgi:hypothetical protein